MANSMVYDMARNSLFVWLITWEDLVSDVNSHIKPFIVTIGLALIARTNQL